MMDDTPELTPEAISFLESESRCNGVRIKGADDVPERCPVCGCDRFILSFFWCVIAAKCWNCGKEVDNAK